MFDGFTAVDDQGAAAAILQVGGMLFLWLQLGYRFIRWANRQVEADRAQLQAMPRTGPSAP